MTATFATLAASTALALSLAGAPALAQEQTPAPEQPAAGQPAAGTPGSEAPDSGTTTVPAGQGATVEQGPAAASGPAKSGPDAWMETPGTWATFNGDLKAQKYSPASQITPDNVGDLAKV